MDTNKLITYEEAAVQLGFVKEDKSPDLEALKRFIRKYDFPIVLMGDENSRRRMIRQSDVDKYILTQVSGKPIIPQPNKETGETNTDNELAKLNTDIEAMDKAKILHEKTLEYNALRAGFKTSEEYKQALANLKVEEDKMTARETALKDITTELEAREIVVKDKEDTIEDVCNDKLTECQNTCDDMIAETRKECAKMVADKKVEVNKKANTEFDNMEWAVHQFEDIETIINQWEFYDYANELDISINWLVEALNQVLAGELATQDLRGEFKKAQQIVSNLMEYTQGLKRGADKFVELRNSIGRILDSIVLRLSLDDERRGHTQTPALPSD